MKLRSNATPLSDYLWITWRRSAKLKCTLSYIVKNDFSRHHWAKTKCTSSQRKCPRYTVTAKLQDQPKTKQLQEICTLSIPGRSLYSQVSPYIPWRSEVVSYITDKSSMSGMPAGRPRRRFSKAFICKTKHVTYAQSSQSSRSIE